MIKTIIEGFLLGLSTGTICLVTCSPIYLPYLISEDRSLRKNFGKVLEISVGRFIAYLIFGAAAGWLGSHIPLQQRTLFTGISFILLSIFLILNAIRTHRAEKHCQVSGWMKFTHSAFILGIISGLNFCPSFLMALTKAIDLGGTLGGTLLFMGFFVGTTLFILPLGFTGLLTSLGPVKKIARYASIVIAVWFIWQGVANLFHLAKDPHAGDAKTEIINPLDAKYTAYVFSAPQDSIYASSFADSLAKVYPERPKVIIYTELKPQQMYFDPDFTVLYFTASLWEKGFEQDLDKNNYVVIPAGFSIPQAINFLKTYDFKVSKEKGFHWTFKQ
jgi:sulfite exporter TauE/SafE